MIATMDDVQYKEHKLAEKAQRIIDIKQDLEKLKAQEEELHAEKPTCDKDKLTYEESIKFGQKVNRYEEELHQVQVKILKLKRQLSALELQAQNLMPVTGVRVKVSKYSDEGQPLQTYCIRQKQNIEEADSDSVFRIEKL